MNGYRVTFLRGLYMNRVSQECFVANDIKELHQRIYKRYGHLLAIDQMRVVKIVPV